MAAEDVARAALAKAGATRWVDFAVTQSTDKVFTKESRGRPGAESRYKSRDKTVFTIEAEVLGAYRYQPNLERRNHMLKGPQIVAPVYLENPHRIEALLMCHFLALLTEALIEREIRSQMKAEALAGMPMYPKLRNCPPRAPRVSWSSSAASSATTC